MDSHQNARTTPHSRAEIVRRLTAGQQPARVVAQAFGICERTVREMAGAVPGGAGRRPGRSVVVPPLPRATPAAVVAQVEALRRARWTGARIAPAVALSRATVGRILRRLGLARLRQLAPCRARLAATSGRAPGPAARISNETRAHRRAWASDHGDRRHRARGVGWEYVHVAIDDRSRLS